MKYREQYEAIHRGGAYLRDGEVTNENHYNGGGFRAVKNEVKQFVDENPGCMLLEYGCGSSLHWHNNVQIDDGMPKTLAHFLGENLGGFYRYDPFHPIYKLRPPKTKYDCVIVTDVLEHIPVDELPTVLNDIYEHTCSCGKIFFSISTKPSKNCFIDGENTHCTIKKPQWWNKMLKKYIKRKMFIKYN